MSAADSRSIGQLAEKVAGEHLKNLGWLLARYGKEMKRKPDRSIPVVHDNCLNLPFGSERDTFKGDDDSRIIDEFIADQNSLSGSFVRANVIVNKFIWSFFVKWCEENPEPFPMSLNNKPLSEKEIEENRKAMHRFPGHEGHPGRYDFIGFKDDEYAAIEVKSNSSRLSYWQEVRLCLLEYFGVKTILVQVDFDDYDIKSHSISLLKIPESKIMIPEISEIVSVIGHKPMSERLQEVKRKKNLSSFELLELLQAGFSVKEIVEKYE